MDAGQLTVFGYSARLFPALDGPQCNASLIELDAGSGAPLRVDRYDIRHLVPQPLCAADCAPPALADPEVSPARFVALADAAVREHEVYDMGPAVRRAYIAGIGQPWRSEADRSQDTRRPQAGTAVALQYDGDGVPQRVSPGGAAAATTGAFVPPFAVPDGMAVPETRRHFEIVEHTARFIAEQPADRASQMEIVIQGKQGTNADFGFLHRSSSLHQFYQHLLWLLRTGLFAYSEDSPSPGSVPGSPACAPPSPVPRESETLTAAPPDASPDASSDQETQQLQAKRRRLAAEFLRRKRAGATR